MRNVASRVIEICGGFDAVAEFTGKTSVTVRKWTYSKEKGGTGGLIPAQYQQRLLDVSRERGLPLAPSDFFVCAARVEGIPAGEPFEGIPAGEPQNEGIPAGEPQNEDIPAGEKTGDAA